MQTNASLQAINDQEEQITTLSQELSSGLKLNSASDDPSAWAQSMNITQSMREYDSCISGISFATGWGDQTESTLSSLSDLVTQAKSLAIQAASSTTDTEKASLYSEVNSVLAEVKSLANTQYNGQYIFAGTSTSTSPYSIDSSGNVTYSGNSEYLNVKTSTSTSADGGSTAVNLTGTDVFTYTSDGTTTNILSEIYSLGQAIESGDSTTISAKITTLSDASDHVNNELTVIGDKLTSLSDQSSAISVINTNSTSTLSSLQDVDTALATTQLTQAETAFTAALKVTATLGSLNLASYLT